MRNHDGGYLFLLSRLWGQRVARLWLGGEQLNRLLGAAP